MAGECDENGDPLEEEPVEDPFEDDAIEDFANQKFTITPAGRELFVAVSAIERWLEGAPKGTLNLVEDNDAQATLGAFIDGWGSRITHALANGPLTLAQLEGAVEDLDRETLEARVAAMRGSGLLSAHPSDGEGASYAVTDWLREAIGPMVVAVRSEWRAAEAAEEMEELDGELEEEQLPPRDVEAALVLALPLLELPAELSGVCRLAVDLPESEEGRAGTVVRVEGGRITSCSTELGEDADAWAFGTARAWMDAVIDNQAQELELGGDQELASGVLSGLRTRFFPR